MNWMVKNDIQRGYNFAYDGLNRLTSANYLKSGQSSTDYSTSYGYDKLGNITSLSRNGLANKPSTFGAIDNLTLNYNGNQLSSVDDSATDPLYSGAFNFVEGSNSTTEYAYDANGNLTQDSNKGIAKIQYNSLNLPKALQFTYGHTAKYFYDSSGVKHLVMYTTVNDNLFVPMGSTVPVPDDKISIENETMYCGNVIYEDMDLRKILTDEGFITLEGTTPVYHYYIRDYQGNNRVVFNQNGTIEQTNHYYPFGMTFGEGITASDQRYKYNNKELDRMHGLDWYDYGARHLDATIPVWGAMDPMAEKYYSVSPYVYCANNPINRIDPNGMDWFVNNNTGEVYYQKELTSINNKYAKDHSLGKADSWEKLGGNTMFDSKDMKYSNLETMYLSEKSALGFMDDHGYEKTERVSIEEKYVQSWEPREPGVGKVTYNHYELAQTGRSEITYMKPEQLDKKTNFRKQEQKYDYNKFETVRYDLTKPYGQSNNKTAYYLRNKQSDNFNTGLSATKLLFDLLKLFHR